MLLDTYKNAGLLFNLNFMEATSSPGLFGFRGELVLVEGEPGDAKGHAKPPEAVMRGAALLADEKLRMLVGALDDVAQLPLLLRRYQDDFAPGIKILLYVVNLSAPLQVEVDGVLVSLIPLVQGVPWNEALDDLGLEKSDLKGLSAADKIKLVCDELKGHDFKSPVVDMDEALASTVEVERQTWGAI